jgi:murein DD-endopeptidase MepM/ murein hydrolase activator NlpD
MKISDYTFFCKKYFLFFCVLTICSGSFFLSSLQAAEEETSPEVIELNRKIDEKRRRVKELESAIEDYKSRIDTKRREALSLSNQLAIIDNRIAEIGLDIELTKDKIDTVQYEIDLTTISITQKEAEITKGKKLLAALLREMQYKQSVSVLEVLSSYSTFSEFYDSVYYLKTVEHDISSTVKDVKAARTALEQYRTSQEDRKKAFTAMQQDLEQKKQTMDEQYGYKSTVLAQTRSSELTYKTLLGSLRSQYQQIEGEITGIEREVRKKLAELQGKNQLPQDEESAALSWPTQSRYVTAYFHDVSYPYRNIFEHNAIDIRASHGTPIKAASSGYIARAKRCTLASCYAYVMIVHAGGISTVYGHLSSISVQEEQFVTRGDIIGYSGATPGTAGAGPFTTGPHLHFEVRKDGIPVNPLNYLVKDY